MNGDVLDLVLLAVCVVAAFLGFRQGFVIGVLSFVGVIGGGYLGTRLAPVLARHTGHSISTPVLGILVVFVLAGLGQALASGLGAAVRRRLTWRPARTVDNAGGAALSAVSVLVVAWLLGVAVAHSSLTGLASQVRRSLVIQRVNDVIPSAALDDLSEFRRLLDDTGFPAIVGPLSTEPVPPISPPDQAVLSSAGLTAARASVVKIRGAAPSCSRSVEGSGFVVGADRILTNAHVVAGVSSPVVTLRGGGTFRARVVLFDPDRDLAVLAVDGLSARTLAFAGTAPAGTDAVVAGYPEDGPFSAVAARVRDRQDIRGPNIYQDATVTRNVYAVRAQVLPGNSGGPLLATDGRVYGVVFAASTDTADTGYALTASEVAGDVRSGLAAGDAVSTRGCD